jgi:hypothetical protein
MGKKLSGGLSFYLLYHFLQSRCSPFEALMLGTKYGVNGPDLL